MLLATPDSPDLEFAARRVPAPAPRRAGRPPKPCERCGGPGAKDRNSLDGKCDDTRDTAKDHGFAEGFRLCDECHAGTVTGRLQKPRRSRHIGTLLDGAGEPFGDIDLSKLPAPEPQQSIWEQVDAVKDQSIKSILQQIADGKGIRAIEDEQGWAHGTGIIRLRAAVGGDS